LIRRIRDLLYEQGFTISGARNRLTEAGSGRGQPQTELNGSAPDDALDLDDMIEALEAEGAESHASKEAAAIPQPEVSTIALSMDQVRQELISIRGLLVI